MDWSKTGSRYGYTLLLVATAATLDVIIEKATELHLPAFLFMAVFLAGWYRGRGPAWFAAISSILVFAYFFASPVYSFRVDSRGEAIFAPFLMCIAVILAVSHVRDHVKDRVS